MRRVELIVILVLGFGLWPESALASSLKVSPLKYQEIVPADKAKLGFVDVSNPTDSSQEIISEVQAFRQTNLEGDLEFYQDARIAEGIQVATKSFVLGPREAARIAFTIDPVKLGKGGAYGVIFFRTAPPVNPGSTSSIATSTKVGTLIILNVGSEIKAEGRIKFLKLPWLQLGKDGIKGTVEYANTASLAGAVAFNPTFQIKAAPWGKSQLLEGPLVMPGNTRRIDIAKPGSYLGPVPLRVNDQVGGGRHTVWVLAATGFWPPVLLVLFCLFGLAVFRLVKKP
jgi:hypothetical protein